MAEKNARNFFLRFSRISGAKKLREKTREKFFLYHYNVESKKMDIKKRAENFFRFTRMSRAKNGVKKTREKFFYDSHEYREQKNV